MRVRILGLVLLFLGPAGPLAAQAAPVPGLARCRRFLAEAEAAGIRAGFVVLDPDTGDHLLDHGGERSLVPASNMKLLTSAVALLALGPGHVLRTELLAHGERQGSMLHGSLCLRGEGDPTLRSEGVSAAPAMLARRVRDAGIRVVTRDLVLDDRAFDRVLRGPAWPRAPSTRRWIAPVAALALDHATVNVRVSAGSKDTPQVTLTPAGCGLLVHNRLRTCTRSSEHVVDIRHEDGGSSLGVRGRVLRGTSGQVFEVAVPDPVQVFGALLVGALEDEGVQVRGDVRRPREGEHLKGGRLLARLRTPVSRILPELLEESQNNMAEMLFKHLGMQLVGSGSFDGGAQAVEQVLERHGVPMEGVRVRDGSGLSRENRLTARALAALLGNVWRSDHARLFREALAAGGEGTLRSRLRRVSEGVTAKTGTLNGVSALSGYVDTPGGDTLVFACLTNSRRRSVARMRDLQDDLVRALAGVH